MPLKNGCGIKALSIPGAYAAFSAGGGGGGAVHFKLEWTSCQQSLRNIYLCTIRKMHPFLLRKETFYCVRKIRNIIVSTTDWK